MAERIGPYTCGCPKRSVRGVAGEVTRLAPPQVTAAHAGEERAQAVVPAARLRRDQPGEDRVLGKGVGQHLAEQGCLSAASGADGLGVSAGGYRLLGHRTPPSARLMPCRATGIATPRPGLRKQALNQAPGSELD